MKWQGENAEPQAIPSLTNEQLFFVAYAQPWCGKMSPEMERIRVASDVHAHPRFRVIGAVSNNPQFWTAFECAEGTPMHPKNACEVW
jgi:predicted metalloendopeptidase